MIDIEKKVLPRIRDMHAYTPGEQPNNQNWVKLNTNELPYAPSPSVKEAIISYLGEDAQILRLYPNPTSLNLRQALADYYNLKPENVIATNGSDDLLNIAIRVFAGDDCKVLSLNPSYSLYPVLSKIQSADFEEVDFNEDMSLPYDDIFKSSANLFLFTNPNAPTGVGYSLAEIEKILKGFDGIVLVDEAYAPFAECSAASLVAKYENLIVSSTSSKGWGLAGMRVGWGLASEKIIEQLDKVRDSYNLDSIAQVAAISAIKDVDYYNAIWAKIKKSREDVAQFIKDLNWKSYKSSSNFILFEPKNKSGECGADIAKDLFEFLKDRKFLVRYFGTSSVNTYLRLSIGTHSQMLEFKEIVAQWLK